MEPKIRYSNSYYFERPQAPKSRMSRIKIVLRIIVALAVYGFILSGVAAYIIISPPNDFKTNSIFKIEEGKTFDQIAESLKSEGYIRSKIVLKIIHRGIFLENNGAVAGEYVFDTPLSAFDVAKKIDSGDFDMDQIRITVPEGLNKFEVARLLKELLPDLDSEVFIALAKEGYIFPDTYFFSPNISTEAIVEAMHANFNKKIVKFLPDIEKSDRTLEEIITMASIVETEARQFETRQVVANILWNRIDQKIPLQVDVSFKYINGKTTFDLTLEDLAVDSPYNTYKYLGLPPTPIANPGLDSIEAVIMPKKTDYLYFLTGKDGTMYYATNFEDHKKNKENYLR